MINRQSAKYETDSMSFEKYFTGIILVGGGKPEHTSL